MSLGKKVIYGCESRGDGNSAYLTRFTLVDTRWFQLCLHIFHRSDADDLHDHPWPFFSLMLWRGYWEVTPNCDICEGRECRRRKRNRKWPLMVLFRSATHKHRVELVDGKRAVSLVLMGKRVRQWGFFTSRGWQLWTEYFKEKGC